ncbi:MAG: NAD(P)-dependent oxidoreductase [Acidiferrobacterales bacterium]|nr:NAD(P)-dependent oxidoreductase [Acidiferrobacterales bacterium]
MLIGIPREIKPQEGRVALLPTQVKELVSRGHRVLVESDAGVLSEAPPEDYAAAGAELADNTADVYGKAELIVKVKEILAPEYAYLRADHTLFTNVHAAANREQLDKLLEAKLTAIAAEETHEFGSPNSVLAGEVGALEGARLVLSPHGGTGRHFMPHFGAPAVKAVVLGLGGVGRGVLRTLLGLGMAAVGLDVDAPARRDAQLQWCRSDFIADHIDALPLYLREADLVLNCVLWDKSRTDHLITRQMLKDMKPGAVIVDSACDPAGAIETSRPTTWKDPVYDVDGIRHFCVDNIPAAVPVTASAGYAAAILPFVKLIAEHGALQACRENPRLARGLTVVRGILTHAEAARVQGRPHTPVETILAAPP